MADISTYLTSISNDKSGEDVRTSIVAASKAICDEAMEKGLSFKEVLTALLPKIQENLDKFIVPDGTLTITEPGTYDVTEYERVLIQIPRNDEILAIIEEGQ